MKNNFYKNLWIKKRELIQNNYQFNKEWGEIIDEIFKERIEEYYFNPIKIILDKGK
jgi:hemerythrin-like domain-containing protein